MQDMIVPFGRYKGKPLSEMLKDRAYLGYQLQDSAVRQMYPEFFSVLKSCVGQGGLCADRKAGRTPSDRVIRSYRRRGSFEDLTRFVVDLRFMPVGRSTFNRTSSRFPRRWAISFVSIGGIWASCGAAGGFSPTFSPKCDPTRTRKKSGKWKVESGKWKVC